MRVLTEPYCPDRSFETPRTPTSDSDEDVVHATYTGEEEEPAAGSATPKRKPGGYDSRIEQILYENPDMSILITDAGKSLESGGRYIVYTIRTGVRRDIASERNCTNLPLQD